MVVGESMGMDGALGEVSGGGGGEGRSMGALFFSAGVWEVVRESAPEGR